MLLHVIPLMYPAMDSTILCAAYNIHHGTPVHQKLLYNILAGSKHAFVNRTSSETDQTLLESIQFLASKHVNDSAAPNLQDMNLVMSTTPDQLDPKPGSPPGGTVENPATDSVSRRGLRRLDICRHESFDFLLDDQGGKSNRSRSGCLIRCIVCWQNSNACCSCCVRR